jgi:hypothetical protein
MLLPLLIAGAALADDVLVPEFTPASAADFGVSYLIYDSILYDLTDRGVSVVDAERIRGMVGDRGDSCIEVAECPDELFDHFPAKLAVVGWVEQTPEGLYVKVELHDPNNSIPVKTIEDTVAGGAEYEFTGAVADTVLELLPLVSPRDMSTTADPGAVPVYEEPPDLDAVLEDAFDEPYVHEEVKEEPKEERGGRLSGSVAADKVMLGVGDRGYNQWRESGMPMDTWARDVRLRSYQLSVEVLGGVGIGNIADSYDVRVAFDVNAGEELDTYEAQALDSGVSFQGALAIGFHPRAWVETGLMLGLQRGSKDLSVGWESYNAGQMVDDYEYTYDPASAWQLLIEPRARFFVLPTGVVKPYGLVGLGLRMRDGYEVPQSGLVEYPDADGGTVLDVVVGAGTMVDLNENLGLVFEAPFGYSVAGVSGYTVESDRLSETPESSAASRTLLRLSAGIQTRF